MYYVDYFLPTLTLHLKLSILLFLILKFALPLPRSRKGVPISAEIIPNEPRTGNAV